MKPTSWLGFCPDPLMPPQMGLMRDSSTGTLAAHSINSRNKVFFNQLQLFTPGPFCAFDWEVFCSTLSCRFLHFVFAYCYICSLITLSCHTIGHFVDVASTHRAKSAQNQTVNANNIRKKTTNLHVLMHSKRAHILYVFASKCRNVNVPKWAKTQS